MPIPLSYDSILAYHHSLSGTKKNGPLYKILSSLEDILINARDDINNPLPVYLTKWRVKSANSIYLKTKRKSDPSLDDNISSLDDITDYAGLRVLCLFEQDLVTTNEYIVNTILPHHIADVTKVKLFNWGDGALKERLLTNLNTLRQTFPQSEIRSIDTKKDERGYKSIHYVVYVNHLQCRYPVEIQARTLLQDVWGELEHAIVYKRGNVNPHIKKSFYLLSRDLETSDMLMTHLRNIRDKETSIERFAKKNSGPFKVFGYEESLLPSVFMKGGKLREAFEKFDNHTRSDRTQETMPEWINTFTLLYEDILETLGTLDRQEKRDSKIAYWVAVEEAFLDFVKGDLTTAETKYEQIINAAEWKNKHYVPHFRLGEIRFINGEIEKALVDFDKSEAILEGYKNSDSDLNKINAYRIDVKLANAYWQLGKEYAGIAIKEIKEAERIFEENQELFTEGDYRSLINNLCWYHLEKFVDTNREEDYEAAAHYYMRLEEIIEKSDSHNAFDTAMWFCYQSYLKSKTNRSWLDKAVKYCVDGQGKKIYSTNKILSENIYRSHVQEIISVNESGIV